MLAAAALLVGVTWWDGQPMRVGLPVLIGFSLGVCLPLLARRRAPLAMAALSGVFALIGSGIDHWPGRFAAMVAMCSAACRRPWRLVPMILVSLGWALCYGTLVGSTKGMSGIGDLLVFSLAPIAAGYALRLQRERADQAARLAVAEDRTRLARDVHDSVGHHLTAIRMQAAAAQRTGESATADRALGTIKELASSALSEVRELVRSLGDQEVGVADVHRLAARLSGPDRHIAVHGVATALPPAVDHTVFRVVQEALTNAVRHSDATELEVDIRSERGSVLVSVRDNGSPTGSLGDGQGIRGMRDRVGALGGTLAAGYREQFGWVVEAEVPIGRTVG